MYENENEKQKLKRNANVILKISNELYTTTLRLKKNKFSVIFVIKITSIE